MYTLEFRHHDRVVTTYYVNDITDHDLWLRLEGTLEGIQEALENETEVVNDCFGETRMQKPWRNISIHVTRD